MALRRKATAPQTQFDVVNERIERLEKQVKSLRQAGPTTIQAADISVYAEPIPWETVINHPGTHADAAPTDPLVYYHPGTIDQPGGTIQPGFKAVGGESRPWIAVYDDIYGGQSISTTSSGDNLQFPGCDWSDNAGGIFSYTRSAGTIGGPNSYNPKLLVDGVYNFTIWEVSNTGNTDYAVDYYLDTGMLYPGRKSGQADISSTYYVMDQNAEWSNTWYWWFTSLTLPLRRAFGNPGTVYPYIRLRRPSAAADFDLFFSNRLWITYLGPVSHANNFATGNDPYPVTP